MQVTNNQQTKRSTKFVCLLPLLYISSYYKRLLQTIISANSLQSTSQTDISIIPGSTAYLLAVMLVAASTFFICLTAYRVFQQVSIEDFGLIWSFWFTPVISDYLNSMVSYIIYRFSLTVEQAMSLRETLRFHEVYLLSLIMLYAFTKAYSEYRRKFISPVAIDGKVKERANYINSVIQ